MTTIERAAQILRAGEIVAFPTETVYGLGADARNAEAVARIFECKKRPRFDPLIVHVAHVDAAQRWAAHWPSAARRLAERFWPGPLTVVLPKVDAIPDLVTAGRATVGLRVPAHPVAQDLLEAFQGPVAAPSANPFSRVSPTTAEHVRTHLPDVDVVDGGPSQVGLESTIVGFDEGGPLLLRPGGLALESIESEIGPLRQPDALDRSASPGRADKHYATRTPLYLEGLDERPSKERLGQLAFRTADPTFVVSEVLSPQGNM
ncbi:MAG: L-threonylcarbamoyladenylate synthase, partial [Myxococcota bacterium]